MNKGYCFVSGSARSGTSELVRMLNCSPTILIGMERFFYLIERRELNHKHFSEEYFGNIKNEDTHADGALIIDMSSYKERFESSKIIGDKYPNLYEYFDYIFEIFPKAKHLYILRNPLSVAESYQARFTNPEDPQWLLDYKFGLANWNKSVSAALNLNENQLSFFKFICYEKIFGDFSNYKSMMNFLSTPPMDESQYKIFSKRFAKLSAQQVVRNDEIRQYVAEHANWHAYQELIARTRHQQ